MRDKRGSLRGDDCDLGRDEPERSRGRGEHDGREREDGRGEGGEGETHGLRASEVAERKGVCKETGLPRRRD